MFLLFTKFSLSTIDTSPTICFAFIDVDARLLVDISLVFMLGIERTEASKEPHVSLFESINVMSLKIFEDFK